MTRPLLTLAVILLAGATLMAQWLDHPTPDLPRTADGKPNLSAPAPRTTDGRPDLSGLWRINGIAHLFNVLGNQPVEMLPWARDTYTSRSHRFGQDSPESNCLPPGPTAGLFGMAPVKFVQTKNLLVLIYEDAPTRQVFLDGRPLPKDPNPTWMGYSVGRWDGDTLVVDTSGYNDRTWLDLSGHPHTEALRVTERFRRLDTGRMQLSMTFDDPKTYTRPWTISMDVQLAPDTELIEFVCNENEKSSRRYTGDATDLIARAVKLPPAVLTRYAGEYNGGPLGMMRVIVDGDALVLTFLANGSRHAIVASSEEDLIIPDLGVPVRFVKTSGGEVTHLRVITVEGDIDAPRVR